MFSSRPTMRMGSMDLRRQRAGFHHQTQRGNGHLGRTDQVRGGMLLATCQVGIPRPCLVLPSESSGSLAFRLLVGLVGGSEFNPLKVKLLAGDLRTAQVIQASHSRIATMALLRAR